MTRKEKALKLFQEDFNCAQSVLTSFSEELGLTEDQTMSLGVCFGGGMRKGEVCGAVSGAMMVIGLKYGQGGSSARDYKEKSYPKGREFMDRFKEKNGSCLCKEILGCNISTQEGMKQAEKKNLFHEICPKLVASAVDILEEDILQAETK